MNISKVVKAIEEAQKEAIKIDAYYQKQAREKYKKQTRKVAGKERGEWRR